MIVQELLTSILPSVDMRADKISVIESSQRLITRRRTLVYLDKSGLIVVLGWTELYIATKRRCSSWGPNVKKQAEAFHSI
jgi:hypothetical protein